MTTFLWIFIGIAIAAWFISWCLFAKFRKVPDAPVPRPNPAPRISIIIPCRDEEDNLTRLLPSITSQAFPIHEIIVMDDHSTDRTSRVAREHGAIVITGKPLPNGWKGKPWACLQGAAAATGDWLLFLDADVWLEPGAFEKLAALTTTPRSVFSLCPFHRIEKPYEELSSFFNSIMVLGINAFTLRGEKGDGIGLFGQVMLVAKTDYDAVGGHEPVKHEVLENFHLARHFAAAGLTNRCYLGKGTASMRMFPSGYEELAASWGKGAASGSRNTPRTALIGISIWLTGLMTAMISLLFLPLAPAAPAIAIGIVYAAFALQSLFVFRKIGTFSLWNALLFPIALCYYQVHFFNSLRRTKAGGTVKWKGRDVSAP